MIGTISTMSPALLPVELRKICMKGEKDCRTESTSPKQKSRVIAAVKARQVLKANAMRSECGIVRDASLAFSAGLLLVSTYAVGIADLVSPTYSCAPSYRSRCDCSRASGRQSWSRRRHWAIPPDS